MLRLRPGSPAPVTDDEFRDAYEFPSSRTWVRASFVVSLDGSTVGPDGSSRSIASRSDRRVFSTLRMRGDVVLVGAGTVRDERYGPSRRPTAIVTRRLDLSPDLPLFTQDPSPASPTLILTSEAAAARAPQWLQERAEIVPCGPDDVDMHRVVSALSERGLHRIHCEGGPSLLRALLTDGLVDELAVSVSPVIVGAPRERHLVDLPGGFPGPSRWRVTHALEEDGTVFLLLGRKAP